MKFSEWLRAAMTDLGWSQNEVARRSDVPQPTITRLLGGSNPKEATIAKIKAAVEPHLSAKQRKSLGTSSRGVGSPPVVPHGRDFDPASVEDPFARIEAALADLLILDGKKDAVMALIHEQASESAALIKAFMERGGSNRRHIEQGPPEDIPERRGSGFATFEGYTIHQTPAHYKVERKEGKK